MNIKPLNKLKNKDFSALALSRYKLIKTITKFIITAKLADFWQIKQWYQYTTNRNRDRFANRIKVYLPRWNVLMWIIYVIID